MPNIRPATNRVRAARLERGWSQDELARRAGISRAAVSAIEIDRLVTSVANALALAAALGCTVEQLFGESPADAAPIWAVVPAATPCRYWQAIVNERTMLYPVEGGYSGIVAHDGIFRDGELNPSGERDPSRTLVMATCDPAVNLLAAEMAQSGIRLLTLPRSSRKALELLQNGVVHVAGIHLASESYPEGNRDAVKQALGAGFRLLRIARWQEGLAVSPAARVRSVRSALSSNLRWVGREPGSGARQCLDELLANRPSPRRLARDHRGVAEAVRAGWADIGVCLRLTSDEAGLQFLPIRTECYDLCYHVADENDPRIQSLIRAIQSRSYRRILSELPGFDTTEIGAEFLAD